MTKIQTQMFTPSAVNILPLKHAKYALKQATQTQNAE